MRANRMLAQSAMEYLMTYGWAILIIAVVLGALFQLGVFNAGTFSPRAPPGACQVFRPNGPESTSFLNLEGVCSGELPQYTGVFTFGGSDYVDVANSVQINFGAGSFTIGVWAKATYVDSSYGWQRILAKRGSGAVNWYSIALQSTSQTPILELGGIEPAATGPIQLNKWYYIVGKRNGTSGVASIYVNGDLNASVSGATQNTDNSGDLQIGCWGGGQCWGGNIANLQIYNTSLSSNEIQYLYSEGIGGAPVNLEYLVGWWPLNGNANDYSGDNINGVPNGGMTYTNQWVSGYTPP